MCLCHQGSGICENFLNLWSGIEKKKKIFTLAVGFSINYWGGLEIFPNQSPMSLNPPLFSSLVYHFESCVIIRNVRVANRMQSRDVTTQIEDVMVRTRSMFINFFSHFSPISSIYFPLNVVNIAKATENFSSLEQP